MTRLLPVRHPNLRVRRQMTWPRLAVGVSLATLLGVSLAGAQEKPVAPRSVDEATATAWKKAGAQVGWLGTNVLGLPEFRTRPDGLSKLVPAFRFGKLPEKLAANLPDPALPFGLDLLQVTNAGLKELAGLKSLHTLNLSSTKVTDVGLKELAGLKSLHTLNLSSTKVTDAGLKELAGLKSLHTLSLDNTKVTDAGLKELAGLKSLHTLNLSSTKVTDAGLKELAGLKNLQTLSLSFAQVTDAGLKELVGLKGLQKLFLTEAKVTDAGVGELRKALPACTIFH